MSTEPTDAQGRRLKNYGVPDMVIPYCGILTPEIKSAGMPPGGIGAVLATAIGR